LKTSRLKNIVILILLFFNAFLLILLLSQQMQQRSAYNRSTAQLQQLFEANNISLDTDLLSADNALSEYTVTTGSSIQEDFASALLGSAAQSETGTIVRYESSKGICQFRASGAVEASFTECLISDPLAFCEKLFQSYGYSILPADRAKAENVGSSGSGTIVGTRCIDDSVIYNALLSFTFSGKKLTAVTGTLLPSLSAGSTIKGISATTALVEFLDYYSAGTLVCTAVTGLKSGYLLQGTATSQIKLVPIWYVETDVSNYYVDFLTGEVSRA